MLWRSTVLAFLAMSLLLAGDAFAQRGRGRGGGGGGDNGGGGGFQRGGGGGGGDRGSFGRGGGGGGDRGNSGRGGGSTRGGGRNRGGGGGGGGPDVSSMLQGLDRNRNGQIDPDEMQGGAGAYLAPMLRNAGINTGRPISVSELQRLATGGRGQDSGNNNGRNRNNSAPLVPGFGNEFQDAIVPGFGPIDATVQVALNEEYDDGIVRRVDFFMNRADTNHNGALDREEWEGLGGRYNTTEADKNRDGRISRLELAAQMKAEEDRNREEGERGRDGGDRGRDGGPDPRMMFMMNGGGGDSNSFTFGRGGRGGGRGGRGRGGDRGGDRGNERGGDFANFDGGGNPWDQRGGPGGDGGYGGGGWGGGDNGWGGDNGDDNQDGDGGDRRRGRGFGDQEAAQFQPKKFDSRSSYALSSSAGNVQSGTPQQFSGYDQNGDGQVSMSEFLRSGGAPMSALAGEFNRMDGNRDGILTSAEFNQGTDRGNGGRALSGGGPGGGPGFNRGNRGRPGGDNNGGGGDNSDSGNAARANAPANTDSNSTSSPSSGAVSKNLSFATGFIKSKDANGDSMLQADEVGTSKMITMEADSNKDGQLSVEEITTYLDNKK